MLEGTISLPASTPPPDANPNISAEFKISMFAVSGLKVDSLAVHNERYKPYKGVRSLSKAGKFVVRC
jgi:AP-3 complex subunit mu